MVKIDWCVLRTHYPNGMSTVEFTNRGCNVKNVSVDSMYLGTINVISGNIRRCPNKDPMPVELQDEILKEVCVRTLRGCL